MCEEKQTIYIRLDDDIVWIEPSFFEKMVSFRIAYPDYFLISPLIINNALSTYILQVNRKITLSRYYPAQCMEATFWGSGEFACQLHTWFLENWLKTEKYPELYCPPTPIAANRFSINSVCWFGEQTVLFGAVEGDEEEYISVKRPVQLGKTNCFVGNVLAVHFAFFTQRKKLDKGDILNKYADYLLSTWNGSGEETLSIFKFIRQCMSYIENHAEEVNMQEIPYEAAKKPFVPERVGQRLWRKIRKTVKRNKYILG